MTQLLQVTLHCFSSICEPLFKPLVRGLVGFRIGRNDHIKGHGEHRASGLPCVINDLTMLQNPTLYVRVWPLVGLGFRFMHNGCDSLSLDEVEFCIINARWHIRDGDAVSWREGVYVKSGLCHASDCPSPCASSAQRAGLMSLSMTSSTTSSSPRCRSVTDTVIPCSALISSSASSSSIRASPRRSCSSSVRSPPSRRRTA